MIDSSAEQQSKLIPSAKSYGSSSYDKLEKVKVAAGVLAFWRLLWFGAMGEPACFFGWISKKYL